MRLPGRRELSTSQKDAALARASGQVLAHFARRKGPLTLRVREAGQDRPLELPASAVVMLQDYLAALAEGRSLTLVAEDEVLRAGSTAELTAELTTVQAAGLLRVSRPFLIKLLDEKALPHRKVGKHRRIRREDVLAYKAKIDREREAVLDELVREAQESGMGYGRP